MSRAAFCYGLPPPSLKRVLLAHLVAIAVLGLVVALVVLSGCATAPLPLPPPDGLESELELPDAGAADLCHEGRAWVPGVFDRGDRALFCLHTVGVRADAGPEVAP